MSDVHATRAQRDDLSSSGPTVEIVPLWTVQEVAAFLRVPVQTVYSWRAHGTGPQGRRVGKYLRYRPADVIDWFENGAA